MRMEPRYLVVGAIVAAFALYFIASAVINGGHKPAAVAKPSDVPAVQATLIEAQVRPDVVSMRGRTQAARMVSVRSETAGVVAATPVREGSTVGAGQVLCKLKVDARRA